MIKQLPTDGVLSVVTEILVSDMGSIYEVCNHVLDDELFTHQLPAAVGLVGPELVRQHPWLGELEVPPTEDILRWVGELAHRYGSTLGVEQLADPQWTRHNAIQDLVSLVGRDRVIVVEAPEGGR